MSSPAAPNRGSHPIRARIGRLFRLAGTLLVLLVGLPALLLAGMYFTIDVPAPAAVRGNKTATIAASDGSTVLARVVPPEGNRIPVTLPDIPLPVRNAVLSAEDRNFYTNPGYSTSGVLRAIRDNVLNRDNAGGGSTITQQFVKNAFLGNQRTVTRKAKELVMSAKIAREWSKDDILASYLNTIYYGRGAYGIGAAAKTYFDKPVQQLTTAEGAVLAALIRSPSALDPEADRPGLEQRWQYVVDGMVQMGTLAPGERDAIAFPPVMPPPHEPDRTMTRGPEGLLRTQVLQEIRDAGVSQYDIDTGGLQITTTIDTKAQNAALAGAETLDQQPANLRSAVVSIDPQSGAVRAYYGGSDGVGFDFAQAPLQTGSAFKTFAVIAALQQGIPLSKVYDSAPVGVNGVQVHNVENETCGRCALSEAFKRSLNTSFYRLTLDMFDGPRAIADAAHQAGIPESIPGLEGKTLSEANGGPMPSIVLGSYSVRPIDMASAYATLAASGKYHQPYFVQKVVTDDGRVLLDRSAENKSGKGHLPPGEQRISPDIANRTAQAMLPIAGYSAHHDLAGRPSAAKTGTTQWGESGQNKDAWMVGFTPSLSTAVWVGSDPAGPIHTSGGGKIYGSGLPADIWKTTMDGALAGTPAQQLGTPPANPIPLVPAPTPRATHNTPTSPYTTSPPTSTSNPYDILNPSPQAPPPSSQLPFGEQIPGPVTPWVPRVPSPPAGPNEPGPFGDPAVPQSNPPQLPVLPPPPPAPLQIFPGLPAPGPAGPPP